MKCSESCVGECSPCALEVSCVRNAFMGEVDNPLGGGGGTWGVFKENKL